MGNSRHQTAQGRHLFGLDELGFGQFEILERLFKLLRFFLELGFGQLSFFNLFLKLNIALI